MRLYLDAGHGMSNRKKGVYDPGAVAHFPNEKGELVFYEEADLTLELALTTKFIAVQEGLDAHCSRADRNDPCPLKNRAEQANEWGADLLLSFHFNSASDEAVRGCEVWYHQEHLADFAKELGETISQVSGFPFRGIRQDGEAGKPLLLLREAATHHIPALLIEFGFITNLYEASYYLQTPHRLVVAKAIVQAIKKQPQTWRT